MRSRMYVFQLRQLQGVSGGRFSTYPLSPLSIQTRKSKARAAVAPDLGAAGHLAHGVVHFDVRLADNAAVLVDLDLLCHACSYYYESCSQHRVQEKNGSCI